MTKDEVIDLALSADAGFPPPVLLLDGHFGLLLITPHGTKAECGIQVPGEEYHRWIAPEKLKRAGNGTALMEVR